MQAPILDAVLTGRDVLAVSVLVERTAVERLPDVHPRDLADAWRARERDRRALEKLEQRHRDAQRTRREHGRQRGVAAQREQHLAEKGECSARIGPPFLQPAQHGVVRRLGQGHRLGGGVLGQRRGQVVGGDVAGGEVGLGGGHRRGVAELG